MMKVDALTCPACGASCHEEVQANQPFRCAACGSTLMLTDLVAGDQVACARCHAANKEGDEFCRDCGAALTVACPFCYAENPAVAAHCRQCGANLQQALQRKRAWLAEKRAFDEQRLAAAKQAEENSQKAELEGLLSDLDEPRNHPMALYCLHRIGSHAVEPLIATLRNDPDPDARYGSARALGMIGDQRAIPALIKSLGDPEPAVRYWATDALGQLHSQEGVEAIGKLLDDKHEGVRTHAGEVLEQIGGPLASQILKRKRKWWPL
jgi:ribosomal protein L40E